MKNKLLILSPIIASLMILTILILTGNYVPLLALRGAQLAKSAEQSGNISSEEVASFLESSQDIDPMHCGVRFELGRHYYYSAFTTNGKQIEPGEKYIAFDAMKAIDEFKGVIENCPGTNFDYQARIFLARSYYLSDHPEQTIEELNTLVGKLPDKNTILSPIYDTMADAYQRMGDRQNELNSLILSLYSETRLNYGVAKISRIHSIIQNTPSIVDKVEPFEPVGFGKFVTATVSHEGVIRLFAKSSDGLSLGHYVYDGSRWNIVDYLMVDEFVLGSAAMDKNQKSHVVFATGNQLFYVSDIEKIADTILPVNLDNWWWLSTASNSMISAQITSLQMTVDDANFAHLIWSYNSAGLVYTKIVGKNLTDTDLILPYGRNADIKVSGNRVFVVCNTGSEYADVFPSSGTQVLFREKVGDSWQSIIQLSSGNIWSGGASLEVAPDQTVHIVYIEGESAEDARLMHISRDTLGRWTKPESIADAQFRPWIPANYGGRNAAATTMLADGSLVVVWRAPFQNDTTAILGRKLSHGSWGPISAIGIESGHNFQDSPSIIESGDIPVDILKLIWSDQGRMIMFDWKP